VILLILSNQYPLPVYFFKVCIIPQKRLNLYIWTENPDKFLFHFIAKPFDFYEALININMLTYYHHVDEFLLIIIIHLYGRIQYISFNYKIKDG